MEDKSTAILGSYNGRCVTVFWKDKAIANDDDHTASADKLRTACRIVADELVYELVKELPCLGPSHEAVNVDGSVVAKARDRLLNPIHIRRSVGRRTIEHNFKAKNVDGAYANAALRRRELRQHSDCSAHPV